ncbi:hypothetical protein DIC82_09455 [Clostridium beijerinckii]|nr:hypothetical protein DIC82_09455 [Clostridium beijerinckii]
MKMKKLLSVGALVLVLASSTSIGASATTIPDELMNKESILNLIENQYKNGENPTDLLDGIDKDATIGDLVNGKVTDTTIEFFANRPTIYRILIKINNNNGNSIATVLEKVTKDDEAFSKFKADFMTVANKLKNMNDTKGSEKVAAEEIVRYVVSKYENNMNVNFGLDSKGLTTASIEKNGQVIVQINSADYEKIVTRLDNLTKEDVTNAIK